nr:hypothetical protein [Cytophagales bacterium]
MLTEQQILDTLDYCQYGYCDLVQLGHGYYYLIDSRLNVFRGKNDLWAIVIERLAYNPRAGFVMLDLNYHGNCLINLPEPNGELYNYQTIYPIDEASFDTTVDNETLLPNAQFWLVRGTRVALSHNKADYSAAGIELSED